MTIQTTITIITTTTITLSSTLLNDTISVSSSINSQDTLSNFSNGNINFLTHKNLYIYFKIIDIGNIHFTSDSSDSSHNNGSQEFENGISFILMIIMKTKKKLK